jgi:hypothetical protein
MYMSWFNSNAACLGPTIGIGYYYDCNSDDNLPPSGVDYPGYEFHYFVFELPADAESPRINFNALGSDDRAVVTLNGYELGAFGSNASTQLHLGPSGTITRTFSNPFSPQNPDIWFNDSSFFQTGTNVLRMWVNNTGSGGAGTATTHAGGGPSSSVVRGFLTYELDEITPDEMINDLILFFDERIESGDLYGAGPGKSAEHRANALRNKLLAAQSLIEAGDYESALPSLHEVAMLSDGMGNEFIAGDERVAFNTAVLELIDALQQTLP